jgi:transposase-like protein
MTPEAADGRSDGRRFSDEQKRAIVQETEKPGASVAQVCRRHGIATSMVFRWRADFGLSARKAQQLVTIALANGAVNEVPALAVLRMTAIEMGNRRRVFAPADGSRAAVEPRRRQAPPRYADFPSPAVTNFRR